MVGVRDAAARRARDLWDDAAAAAVEVVLRGFSAVSCDSHEARKTHTESTETRFEHTASADGRSLNDADTPNNRSRSRRRGVCRQLPIDPPRVGATVCSNPVEFVT